MGSVMRHDALSEDTMFPRQITRLVLVGAFSFSAYVQHAPAQGQPYTHSASTIREFRDCSGCPAMVVLPSGSFKTGSPPNEVGRVRNDESPIHQVLWTSMPMMWRDGSGGDER